MAAWSGYSAAKWGTESSLSLAKASAFRSKWSLAEIQTTQTRTLDSAERPGQELPNDVRVRGDDQSDRARLIV
jgi:hypothetical protein